MRTDVKLGVVIALATVLVAGGYYMDGGGDEKPIEMTEKSMADAAKTAAGQKQSSRNATAPAKRNPAVNQHNAPARKGKASPGKNHRGAIGQRKPGAKPSARTTPKSANARAQQQNKGRMGQVAASKTPKPKAVGTSVAARPVKSTRPGPTHSGASGPPPARSLGKAVPTAANRSSRRQGTTDARQAKAKRPGGKTSGTPAGSPLADVSKRGKPSGQSARGPSRPNPRGPAQRNGLAKSGKTPARRRNPATQAKKMDHRGVAVDVHRVQPGDSLAALAKMYYGHEKYVPFLMKSNPKIGDPRRLALGTVVRIPPLPTTEPTSKPTSKRVRRASTRGNKEISGSARSYTVKAGDSFYGIARSQLGDARRWRSLYELNASLVGDDPSRLKIGQVLKLPPK